LVVLNLSSQEATNAEFVGVVDDVIMVVLHKQHQNKNIRKV
jgi:hypothetical protein